MTVKCDLLFEYGTYTWEESFYYLGAAAVGSSAMVTQARGLAAARANLMGGGVVLQGVRTSGAVLPPTPPPSQRLAQIVYKAQTYGNPWLPPPEFTTTPANENEGDNPALSTLAKYTVGTGRQINKYMGGLPDSSQYGPGNFASSLAGPLQQNLNVWLGYLVQNNNWGLRVRNYTPAPLGVRVPVATAVFSPNGPGYINITTTTPVFTGSPIPYYIQVRGLNGTDTRSGINKVYRLAAGSTGTNLLLLPAPRTVVNNILLVANATVEVVGYTFSAITDLNTTRTTHRSRGSRGYGSERGRRRV
jgi:hypothetical protein